MLLWTSTSVIGVQCVLLGQWCWPLKKTRNQELLKCPDHHNMKPQKNNTTYDIHCRNFFSSWILRISCSFTKAVPVHANAMQLYIKPFWSCVLNTTEIASNTDFIWRKLMALTKHLKVHYEFNIIKDVKLLCTNSLSNLEGIFYKKCQNIIETTNWWESWQSFRHFSSLWAGLIF